MLAIDPTSPFTGGAILGDRLRMTDHALDDGVFIRSMATRGHLGGLALAVPEAVRVLAAAGLAVGADRDRRRRPGGGRGGRQRRHVRGGRQPRLGRRGAGQQGRADGDRRRVRDQQGRPRRRRRRRATTWRRSSTWPTDRRAAGARRSSKRWPPTGAASPTCGPRSVAHRAAITASGELGRRRSARAVRELRSIVAAPPRRRWRARPSATTPGSLRSPPSPPPRSPRPPPPTPCSPHSSPAPTLPDAGSRRTGRCERQLPFSTQDRAEPLPRRGS